jgi:hypothetical protein
MPANPPLTLSEPERRGFSRIRVGCAKYGWRGGYAVSLLRRRVREEIREALSTDCERHKTIGSSFPEACGARG